GTSTGKLPDGSVRRIRLEPDYGLGIDHKVAAQKIAMDGGKMDGFAHIQGCRSDSPTPYGCFTQYFPMRGTCGSSGTGTCIPNMSQLADDFAVSDRTFEFHATPSWGGHLILGSATIQHFIGDKSFAPPGGS